MCGKRSDSYMIHILLRKTSSSHLILENLPLQRKWLKIILKKRTEILKEIINILLLKNSLAEPPKNFPSKLIFHLLMTFPRYVGANLTIPLLDTMVFLIKFTSYVQSFDVSYGRFLRESGKNVRFLQFGRLPGFAIFRSPMIPAIQV